MRDHQHQGQINAARTPAGYDYSDCFKFVKEEISRADIAVANLEVTLGGKPYRGYPAFSAPDEYLSAIREAGFTPQLRDQLYRKRDYAAALSRQ